MVRIIAPACPSCSSDEVSIVEMFAMIKNTRKLDPIDINLAQWRVMLQCEKCGGVFDKRINDVKAPIGPAM